MREIKADDISKEEFEKISKFYSALNAVGTLQAENYTLSFDDVKELHNKYLPLATDIKGRDKQAGAPYVNEIEGCLISALKHEAQDISKIRNFEYENKAAKLEAKKREETPEYRRRHWYSLIKKPNRAQELVNEEAALNADFKHNLQEKNLNQLEKELEQIEVGYELDENLTFRKRRKLRSKIVRHKRALKRLEKQYRAAKSDEVGAGEFANEPRVAPGETDKPANVQSEERAATVAVNNSIESAKKPKKRTPQPVTVVSQLPGQISIEDD